MISRFTDVIRGNLRKHTLQYTSVGFNDWTLYDAKISDVLLTPKNLKPWTGEDPKTTKVLFDLFPDASIVYLRNKANKVLQSVSVK